MSYRPDGRKSDTVYDRPFYSYFSSDLPKLKALGLFYGWNQDFWFFIIKPQFKIWIAKALSYNRSSFKWTFANFHYKHRFGPSSFTAWSVSICCVVRKKCSKQFGALSSCLTTPILRNYFKGRDESNFSQISGVFPIFNLAIPIPIKVPVSLIFRLCVHFRPNIIQKVEVGMTR